MGAEGHEADGVVGGFFADHFCAGGVSGGVGRGFTGWIADGKYKMERRDSYSAFVRFMPSVTSICRTSVGDPWGHLSALLCL